MEFFELNKLEIKIRISIQISCCMMKHQSQTENRKEFCVINYLFFDSYFLDLKEKKG